MKRCILLSVLCVLWAVLLPAALIQEARLSPAPDPAAPERGGGLAKDRPAAGDSAVSFSFLRDGRVETVTMAEYLPGVLAGEMPASFDSEALRAQAVAARSYALYQLQRIRPAHPEASLCADPGCCQVWAGETELRQRWGVDYDYYQERIHTAVEATDGQYLAYGREPILACFHSSSAGFTEDSAAVWGTALPYLVSVSSPETAGDVPNYVTTLELSPEEFRTRAEAALPETAFPDSPAEWLGERTTAPSGRVSSLRLGNTTVSGTEMRDIFSLRSANFQLEWTGRSFLFTVTGYGHGAGMSQYGANVMAKTGSSYADILAHYYPGTTLVCP